MTSIPRAPDESFLREFLRQAVGMLLVIPFLAVPLLACLAIILGLEPLVGHSRAQWCGFVLLFPLVALSMITAFRLAKRYAGHWPLT